jgi:manganese transport protein
MLFNLPLAVGMVIVAVFVTVLLFTNSYLMVERWVIGFIAIIGLSFVLELCLVHVSWPTAVVSSFVPVIPKGSLLIILSLLGAVVMPGNLYLHSEIIQSRQLNMQSVEVMEKNLKYEFLDTSLSTVVGWAINSAIIIVAAATFYTNHIHITDLSQAYQTLTPLVGSMASVIFASGLLLAGVASTVTIGIAGGNIFSGIFKEPYDIHDSHSKTGVILTIFSSVIPVFFIKDILNSLVMSQAIISMLLPITLFLVIWITSSKKIMGKYKNTPITKALLLGFGSAISLLNIMFFVEFFLK